MNTISLPLAVTPETAPARTLRRDLAITLCAFAIATPAVMFILLAAGDRLYRQHVDDVLAHAIAANATLPAPVALSAVQRVTREAVPGARIDIGRVAQPGGCAATLYTVTYPRLFPVPTLANRTMEDHVVRGAAGCADRVRGR